MSESNHEEFIHQILDKLDDIPDRSEPLIQEGKARFLAQARLIASSPVSKPEPQRHTTWKLIHFKEVKMGTLATILLVIGLMLGGAGATVQAAQDDLPGDLFYPVKLALEDTRLTLIQDPNKKVELDLQFAMRRADEIRQLKESGIEPSYAEYARFENALTNAINVTAGLDELLIPGKLLRIRQTLQICLDQLPQTEDDPLQTRLREMLQDRIHWVNKGITDPAQFAFQVRTGWEFTPYFGDGDQNKKHNQLRTTATPGATPGYPTAETLIPSPTGPYGPNYRTPGSGGQTPGPGYQILFLLISS